MTHLNKHRTFLGLTVETKKCLGVSEGCLWCLGGRVFLAGTYKGVCHNSCLPAGWLLVVYRAVMGIFRHFRPVLRLKKGLWAVLIHCCPTFSSRECDSLVNGPHGANEGYFSGRSQAVFLCVAYIACVPHGFLSALEESEQTF